MSIENYKQETLIVQCIDLAIYKKMSPIANEVVEQ